ncbi:hypothetical protein NP493_457g01022 [Ridgeia piscesae]|uniref:Uncharacterized protein n=1 Tax=Ridgeia piscesae TaxID=27915 RepID=A0AAD9KZ51_RIDPI|nr:hypothetical protein NP493_457g01022 [Ridgeia piscesae]
MEVDDINDNDNDASQRDRDGVRLNRSGAGGGARDPVAMAAEEWAVALILLAVSVALVASVAAICRMLGVWRFPTFFGPPSSEKQQLTRHEEPCYMVTSESELNLSASGTFKHFDTGDARCLDLPPELPTHQPTCDVKVSPESVDSTGMSLVAKTPLFSTRRAIDEDRLSDEIGGSWVELRTLDYENPGSNPVLR